jgi:hypothetical protein
VKEVSTLEKIDTVKI